MGNYKLGYKSLPECVMEYLKKQLSTKELIPGDEINLTAISMTLGISRTPIREALIQLVKEGLVELVSRRKFIIKKLTMDDIKNLYDALGLLEAEASQSACESMKEIDIARLEDFYRKMVEALEQGDIASYLELNGASHDLVVSYCQNHVIVDMLHNLKERLNVIIFDFQKVIESLPEWGKILIADHAVMIQAVKARDKEVMKQIIKGAHWNYARNYPYLHKYLALARQDVHMAAE